VCDERVLAAVFLHTFSDHFTHMRVPHREVASLALYLASDEASFATGAAYALDGGVCCRM
jgi:NAD(P)-dependent dehydrogenase (short-subunit alcohol dehydrogenase family)